MSVWRNAGLVAATAFVAAATMMALPMNANAQTKLTIMVFQGVQNLPLLAAEQQGLFAKNGLAVEVKIAPTSDELRNGLAEGRYQIVHGAVDNAIAMAEVAKKDIAVVIGGDTAINHLFVQPEIKSYADLRGKAVIVDAPNTAYALQLYKMLELNGLKKGDYEVKVVGATFRRSQAMQQDKSNAASMLNPPFSVQAELAGLRDLGSAVKAVGPYQATAGWVMRDWAKANEAVLTSYLKAYLQGLRWVMDPANKAASAKLLAEKQKLTPEVAEKSVALYADPTEGFAKDAAIDMKGFENVLKLRADFQGGTAASPDKYIDLSYYKKALAGL
jgi:ABC-type nitrate/sulfonate/bicarbonate transport system substrate-binding protein